MSTFKHIAAAAVLSATLLGAASPANAAWEFEEYFDWFFEATAWARSVDNSTRLFIGCWDDIDDGGEFFDVLTDEDYDKTASYAVEVPMVVTANDMRFKLFATFRDANGKLGVGATEAGNNLASVFYAIRGTSSPIEVVFFQTRLTFPADNAGRAAGQMIDACML